MKDKQIIDKANEDKEELPTRFSMYLDPDGYFQDLLFKVQEETKSTNMSRVLKRCLLSAAKEFNVIDDEEFKQVLKWRL